MSQPVIFQSKYLLDTNCFINLAKFYPYDVFKSLDTIIRQNIDLKNIQTIEAIYNEEKKGVIDKMLNHYSLNKNNLVLKDRSASVKKVLSHIDSEIARITKHYMSINDKNVKSESDIRRINKDFMGSGESGKNGLGPDGLLIAKARDEKVTVITEETKSNNPIAKKIKIPDVCERFNVKCINFLELLRTENVKL